MSTPLALQDFVTAPQPGTLFSHDTLGTIEMKDIGCQQREALLAFYKKNYRKDYVLSDVEVFEWLFKHNGKHVAALYKDGNVIAHQGHIPVVFSDYSEDHKGFISASTMVDEPYRRMGLMTHLRGNVHERYSMAASLGGSAQGVAMYKKIGYNHLGNLRRAIALVHPALCKVTVEGAVDHATSLAIHRGAIDAVISSIPSFIEISDAVDVLLTKTFGSGKTFGVARRADFLQWRYVEVPYYAYHRFGYWNENGELEGLLVFRKDSINSGEEYIIHIVESLGSERAIASLVSQVLLHERYAHNVAWIDFFCSHSVMFSHILQTGFVEDTTLSPTKFAIFTKPVDFYKQTYPFLFYAADEAQYELLPAFDQWYITKGDGDADRPTWV